jgi:hypothetical protein
MDVVAAELVTKIVDGSTRERRAQDFLNYWKKVVERANRGEAEEVWDRAGGAGHSETRCFSDERSIVRRKRQL